MKEFGLLIDMDGVIYRGGELIEGAADFINRLVDEEVPFLFLTNNSQRTRLDIATKLQRMGLHITQDHIYTCAMSTARFIARQGDGLTAYVIGDGGLMNALNRNQIAIVDKDPDYVVIGEGRSYPFEMLEQATNHILNGAKLIATNMDPNCPTSSGTRPGCGAVVKLLEFATGARAFDLGKPSPLMMRDARKLLDLDAKHTFMIGDNMGTDILGAVQLGYKSVLVLSGSCDRKDAEQYAFTPSAIVDSIAALSLPYLQEMLAHPTRVQSQFPKAI